MTPTIMLKNGKPFLSVGSPGATRIISALPQIIVNVVDFRVNIQDAIEAARIHCMTGDIFMESRIPKAVQDALTAKGHKLNVRGEMDLYFGGAQGIMIAPARGLLYGAGDPRRSLWPVLLAFGSAFFIGLLFGFLPARRAAKLDPVVALATE